MSSATKEGSADYGESPARQKFLLVPWDPWRRYFIGRQSKDYMPWFWNFIILTHRYIHEKIEEERERERVSNINRERTEEGGGQLSRL